MPRDALLAVGVVLSTMTQLRLPGLPVGPGEIMLALWLLVSAGPALGQLDAPLSRPLRRLGAFWLIVAITLCLGTMASFVLGVRNARALFVHDLVAYVLVGSIGLLALFQDRAAERLRRTTWIVAAFGTGLLGVILAQAFGLLPAMALDLWFYDRLIGWTTNANQLALLCLILIFAACHLAETTHSMRDRYIALALTMLPLAAGILTKSDAFGLAVGLGAVAYAGLKIARRLVRSRGGSLGTQMALLVVLLLPAAIASTGPAIVHFVHAERVARSAEFASESAALARDIGYRTALWQQAIERLDESAWLGFGPGPHLARSANLREPQWDPTPNFEAHNTLIDMTLQGGLLALLALVWLISSSVLGAINADRIALAILIIAISGFAMTHFVMRHPLVAWTLAMALASCERDRFQRAR